jgi:hypothetical protein
MQCQGLADNLAYVQSNSQRLSMVSHRSERLQHFAPLPTALAIGCSCAHATFVKQVASSSLAKHCMILFAI